MNTQKRSLVLFGSGIVLASVGAMFGGFACSEADGGPGSILGTAGFAAGVPTGGTGGSTSGVPQGNQPGATAGAAPIIVPTVPDGGSDLDPDAACAASSDKADLRQVNMFIQFDRSGSMLDNDKWTQASAALNAFFADPASAGLRVAARFFPHNLPVAGCTGGNAGLCDVESCATPLVPLGELTADLAPVDAHEALLLQAVASATPLVEGDGTPIYPALDGALRWARNHQAQFVNERTVVILVTDGSPTGCETDIGTIAQLAANAFTNDQIATYAIGIEGANENQLNRIAVAGGTAQAFFAGNTATAQQDLVAALNSIRGTALLCEFPMPAGQDIDPTKVNVNFRDSLGMVHTVGQAPGPDSCQNGGWYYDNPAAPTNISLCPSTCEVVKADGKAELDILLGCNVIPA